MRLTLHVIATLSLGALLLSSLQFAPAAQAQVGVPGVDAELSTYILMVDDDANADAVSESIRAVASDDAINWQGKVKRTHPRISTIIVQGTAGTCKKLREALAEITYCESDSKVFAA